MQMVLGGFVFTMQTATFQTLKFNTRWKWVENDRAGNSPAYQYNGRGQQTMSLDGDLFPEITGGRLSLDALRALADTGLAWPLIDGEGFLYGAWFIGEIDEQRHNMFADGAPRKITFSVALTRYDSSQIDKLGVLSRAAFAL